MIFKWLSYSVVSSALVFIFFIAPLEREEGIVQKIMYLHIPSAWVAFFAFFIVFIASILYLWKREREWDIIAHSSAEVGVVFCSLVLMTGPLWAKPIWGVWWTWDARLTLTLVLWLIYVAYLMLRFHAPEGSQRARFSAVLGIVGFLDVPIIHFSVLWWRTIHPRPKVLSMESPGSGLEPIMLITLIISLLAFTLIFFLLLVERISLERMRDELNEIKRDILLRDAHD
jgi:heme exporter protein C